VDLSDLGRRQAVCLQERFRGEQLAAFYASDLRRAAETAAVIAAPHGLEVQQLPALREMDFGHWEGLTHGQIAALYPAEFKAWFRGPGTVEVPGGESFARVQQRAWAALTEIVARHSGRKVLVVSHGGTIRALICAALGLDADALWHLALDNAAVSVLDFYSQGPVLSLLNDCSHLRCLYKPPAGQS
jgi:alpha-ribazole phosphatase